MNRKIQSFLESRGFKKHPDDPDKMIYPFGPKAGLIVFAYDEDAIEFIMNYLSKGPGDPELIFSGLSQHDLIEGFDKMFQLSKDLHDILAEKGW